MMRFFLDVNTRVEGKTVTKVRVDLIESGMVVAMGEGRASSTSKAVNLALEALWDRLVPVVIERSREIVSGARRPAEPAGEEAGALPEDTGALFQRPYTREV